MFWLAGALCRIYASVKTEKRLEQAALHLVWTVCFGWRIFPGCKGHMGQKGSPGLSRGIFRGGSTLIWTPGGPKLSSSPCQVRRSKENQRASWEPTERRSHRGRRVTSRCGCVTRWQSDKTKTTTRLFPPVPLHFQKHIIWQMALHSWCILLKHTHMLSISP